MKTILTVFLLIITTRSLVAIENHPAGARASSLSNAMVSVSDVWSTFHNQATLGGLTGFSGGFFYESRFLVEELSLSAGTLVFPVKAGTFGFSFSQFGKGEYKEFKTGLAFAKPLTKKLNAAVQLDYFSARFPENDATGFITFETGISFEVTDEITLGAHLFNPVKAGIETAEGMQKMPSVLRFGGHYQFPDYVLISLEAEKNFDFPFRIKSGIEFAPGKNLALRFGVSGKPVNYTAGLGYKVGKISTDIGFGYHGNLGISPSISIQFEL